MGWLTVILVCQLIGEAVSTGFGLPVPGPVIGMVILFAGLVVKGGIPDELGKVTGFLLSNLSLLFVPAGVGVILHFGVLSVDWVPITAALIVSTGLTVAVTALIMARLHKPGRDGNEGPS